MTSMGIDLGTTYSCVGIYRGKNVEIISNEMGNKTTPSMVSFIDDETKIGENALTYQSKYPTQTIFDSKRMIGRSIDDEVLQKDMKNWPFKVIGDKCKRPKIVVTVKEKQMEYFPEEISAFVLKKMSEIANNAVPHPIKDAVITVPAYFSDAQRNCTMDAGKRAGLNVLRIINEPTAAAIAFGLQQKGENLALVFDFGGGTFDVTLLGIEDGIFEIKATDGDDHLGGQDVDNILVDYFADKFNKKFGCDIREDRRAMIILKHECEKVKKILSVNSIATIFIDSLYNGNGLNERLSRSAFNEMCHSLLERCRDPIQRVLNDSNVSPSEVTDLVLVGGSSRIHCVRDMLAEIFPHLTPCSQVDPDIAVAYGAAVCAYQLSKELSAKAGSEQKAMPRGLITKAESSESDNDEVVIVDVNSRSYGVEIEGGKMELLLPKNSTIPTVVRKSFTTSTDFQDYVNILVFQGEKPMTADNLFLGQFQIEVPPKKKGEVEIKVKFDVTSNGVLNVSAEESGLKKGEVHINCISNMFAPGKPNRDPPMPTAVDLCFCVDGTGSMHAMIEAAKEKCVTIAQKLKEERPSISFRYGAVFYRDPIMDPTDITRVHGFTDDIRKLNESIKKEIAKGGGHDGPEDWVSCYKAVLGSQELGWRPRAIKIVIHIADACAHGVEWGGSTHPEQGPVLQGQIELLAKSGFFFSGIMIPDFNTETTFNRIRDIYKKAGKEDRYAVQNFSDKESKAGAFLTSFVVNTVTSIVPK